MSGSDGDDDDLVEIELELDDDDGIGGPPDPPMGPRLVDPDVIDHEPDGVPEFRRQPPPLHPQQALLEAATADEQADQATYEAEAAALGADRRRAGLFLELIRFAERAQDEEGALDAARRAFAAASASPVTIWSLRRALVRAGRWDELATAFGEAARATAAVGAESGGLEGARVGRHEFSLELRWRAELLIERGRILEDHLGRDADAEAAYREAAALAPDHVGALVSLLLLGARRADPAMRAFALGGLSRLAPDPAWRAALAIEQARAAELALKDRPENGSGPSRALDILEQELGRVSGGVEAIDVAAETPMATLLQEVTRLTTPDAAPDVASRALSILAPRVAAYDVPVAVALLRERARLCAGPLADRTAALEALDQAARLDPGHPVVAIERLQLAEAIGGPGGALAIDERARQSIATATSDADAVDLALAHVEIAARAGRWEAATQTLVLPRIRSRRAERIDLQAATLALAIQARDASTFASELGQMGVGGAAVEGGEVGGAGRDARSRAELLVAAAAVRQAWLDDATGAAALYRAALASDPSHSVALDALSLLLRSLGRAAEAVDLLEGALARRPATNEGAVSPAERLASDETWMRARLVALLADELGQAARAAVHQRRLVELEPTNVIARARLVDLELEGSASVGAGPSPLETRSESLLALAAALEVREGHSAAVSALRVEVGRMLVSAGDASAASRAHGRSLLEAEIGSDGARRIDPSAMGLACGALEGALDGPEARAEVVAAELRARLAKAVQAGDAPSDTPADAEAVVRALRFRLAHHLASAGKHGPALESLAPLRASGDAMARAFSYELARQSGDATLELAVLSEARSLPFEKESAGSAARVASSLASFNLLDGEARERTGDLPGAAAAFRRVVDDLSSSPPLVADAALGLMRVAARDPQRGAPLWADAFRGIATAADGDDPSLAAAARREAALRTVALAARPAAGDSLDANRRPSSEDLVTSFPGDGPARVRAEGAIVQFLGSARRRDHAGVCDSLLQMAALDLESAGEQTAHTVPMLLRAAARARIAGGEVAADVAERASRLARAPSLAVALTDAPGALHRPSSAAPDDRGALPASLRPDPRRTRARRVGGTLGVSLDLEAALEAERVGELSAALAAYGSVVSADPDRVEAWMGIRRVARAAGDTLGEARALARLGVVIRDPESAAGMLLDAATAYERAGRLEDAITVLVKAVQLRPESEVAYARVHGLVRGDLEQPGRALLLDALLSHRLAEAPLGAPARAALLFERAQHRARRLGALPDAIEDWKEILSFQPEHREAIYELASASLAASDPLEAAHWLERFLAVAFDDPRVAAARLDLAESYEEIGEHTRAIATLERAAALRPGDPQPLERLAALHLRSGDWRRAIDVMRESEARLPDTGRRAALHLEIGTVLRDLGHDTTAAAVAFRTSAELDPLGEGTRALVALYDAAKNGRGALETIEREIADIRRALAADPLDERRLERLGDYLAMARARGAPGALADAELATASVLALVRTLWESGGADQRYPGRAIVLPPAATGPFWAALADPAAAGFAAELWPHIAAVAASLYPASSGRERRVPLPAADPRFEWIRVTAATLGLANVSLFAAREDVATWVTAIEDGGPGLVLAAGAESAAEARFSVGRALGLLVQRATVLERIGPDDLARLFAGAAVGAGAAAGRPPARGLPVPPEELVRSVSRGLGRKERKALSLQASRFATEVFDLQAWHDAVIRTAERLGLVVADDVGLAAVCLAASPGGGDRSPLPEGGAATSAVATSPAALDVLRFALGEQYPVLRRAVSDGIAALASASRESGRVPGSKRGGGR